MARAWYTFKGAPFDPELPSSYRRTRRSPGTSNCLTGNTICSIYVPSGDITPFAPFSANILEYINDSFSSSVPLPDTGKYYLYKKQL